MENSSENHGDFGIILLLVLSVRDIPQRHGLQAGREKNQNEINKLTNYCQHLQNKVRRATPTEKETLRTEKQGVTEQITELRKRLKYADGIEKRSAHINNCLNQIHDTTENQRSNTSARITILYAISLFVNIFEIFCK